MKRLAAGCVIVKDNSILLVFRIDKNWYEIPGGKVNADEALEEGAIRECKEELGCEVEIIRKLGMTHFDSYDNQYDYTWFLAKIKKGQKPSIGEPDSYSHIKYIHVNELSNYPLSPSIGNLLKEIERGSIFLE